MKYTDFVKYTESGRRRGWDCGRSRAQGGSLYEESRVRPSVRRCWSQELCYLTGSVVGRGGSQTMFPGGVVSRVIPTSAWMTLLRGFAPGKNSGIIFQAQVDCSPSVIGVWFILRGQ